MTQSRILAIEDDDAIRMGIVDALRSEGYAVIESAGGEDGLRSAVGAAYDLLLLDLILPEHDGFEILEAVRAKRPAVPVIILTARGEEDDRVRGLRLGADDYVVKPFSVRELLARVEAVLRRSPDRDTDVTCVAFSGGRADLDERTVTFDNGDTESLSDKETDLLRYLYAQAGHAISREELLARVWGISARGVETRTIDVHVGRLREKLHDSSEDPSVIVTVRRKGYMFAPKAGP